MSLVFLKQALFGWGEPERRPQDYVVGAGGSLAALGAVGGLGSMLAHDARKPEKALLNLEAAAPELAAQLSQGFDVEPGLVSNFNRSTGAVRRGLGSDIGELAHEIAHAQGAKSNVRHALQKAYWPRGAMLGGPLLAIGAGLSGNENLEMAAPFIGIAPALPMIAEEGAAAIGGIRALSRAMREADVGDELRRKARFAMQRKSTHGFLGYLLPALGIAAAGVAAPRVADWASEEL